MGNFDERDDSGKFDFTKYFDAFDFTMFTDKANVIQGIFYFFIVVMVLVNSALTFSFGETYVSPIFEYVLPIEDAITVGGFIAVIIFDVAGTVFWFMYGTLAKTIQQLAISFWSAVLCYTGSTAASIFVVIAGMNDFAVDRNVMNFIVTICVVVTVTCVIAGMAGFSHYSQDSIILRIQTRTDAEAFAAAAKAKGVKANASRPATAAKTLQEIESGKKPQAQAINQRGVQGNGNNGGGNRRSNDTSLGNSVLARNDSWREHGELGFVPPSEGASPSKPRGERREGGNQ